MRTHAKDLRNVLKCDESRCSSLSLLRRSARTLLLALQEFADTSESTGQKHTGVIVHVCATERERLKLHTKEANRNGFAMTERVSREECAKIRKR